MNSPSGGAQGRTADGEPIKVLTAISYSSPLLLTTILFYPVQLLLAGMYAKYFGLPLTTIAAIVFAARLFDAVTDPLIGYLSDHFRLRSGTRKPFIAIGCFGLVVSSYFLFVPPPDVSGLYFLLSYFAFYLAYTLVEIPHLAWGGELAVHGAMRTKFYAVRMMFFLTGPVLFVSMPMLPFMDGGGFRPETLKFAVYACALLMVPIVLFCVKFTPNGRASVARKREGLLVVAKALIQNRPLLILLTGYFFISVGFGLYIGLSFLFADVYLGLGELLPLVYVMSTASGVFGAVTVYGLSGILSKRGICIVAIVLCGIAMVGHAFLEPGRGGLALLATFTCLIYFGNAMAITIKSSMLSDAADYGALKFGADRAATYFAAYSFMSKAVVGMGGAAGLAIVGWYGFDAGAAMHSARTIVGLKLAVAWLPCLTMVLALIAVIRIPLNTRRQEIIQRRLDQRVARARAPEGAALSPAAGPLAQSAMVRS